MVERQEATRQLLVAHQKLAEAVEPAVANLYHPASGLLAGVMPLEVHFLVMDGVLYRNQKRIANWSDPDAHSLFIDRLTQDKNGADDPEEKAAEGEDDDTGDFDE